MSKRIQDNLQLTHPAFLTTVSLLICTFNEHKSMVFALTKVRTRQKSSHGRVRCNCVHVKQTPTLRC